MHSTGVLSGLIATLYVRLGAGSGTLPGTESCVLASEIPRPAVNAEELQRLRISCPAEVGEL